MSMKKQRSSAGTSNILHRRTSRRAFLAGGAALAAAGSAAAVFGAIEMGGGATTNAVSGKQAPVSPSSAAAAVALGDPKVRAAHLLRRAGFGGSAQEIAEFATLSRDEAADRLLNFETIDNSALDERLAAVKLTPGLPSIGEMTQWWLTRMAYTARPLEERMTLIWHGLLTTEIAKVGGRRSQLVLNQNNFYRQNALPRWDDFVKAVGRDPAMLYYLDNIENAKAHPNENYAREQMELFTMGVGNYTEDDVRESARAYTGWRITRPDLPRPLPKGDPAALRAAYQKAYAEYTPSFLISPRLHDGGTKTFLGKTGDFGGDDIVDIIMQTPAAAKHLCTRLFRELANDNPSESTIDRLVQVWQQNDHQVKPVVRAILTSDEFYSAASYRALVRSPVDFIVGMVRALEVDTPLDAGRFSAESYRGMNQVLFNPPSVAGWPGGASWISTGAFFARANFADQFLAPRRGSPLQLSALAGAKTPSDMFDRCAHALVDGQIASASRDAIVAYAETLPTPAEQASAVAYLTLCSPEYQLM
jgi:uncharacterized protein (DUF1800 family)